ncbi:MAG: hypothetical protein WAO75_06265 [Atribacterales bacterium]
MELRIWLFVLPIMLRYLRSGAGEKCLWLIQEVVYQYCLSGRWFL